MLVFAASGQDARLQETTLWMTRRVLRGFHELPATSRPARLLLDARAGRARRPRRPAARRSPARCPRSSRCTARPATATASTGASSPRSTASRPTTAATRSTSSAGAVGWMQFLPSTWRRWGVDASGDGVADPMNPADAIYSAARYLQAAGHPEGRAARALGLQPARELRQHGALDRRAPSRPTTARPPAEPRASLAGVPALELSGQIVSYDVRRSTRARRARHRRAPVGRGRGRAARPRAGRRRPSGSCAATAPGCSRGSPSGPRRPRRWPTASRSRGAASTCRAARARRAAGARV